MIHAHHWLIAPSGHATCRTCPATNIYPPSRDYQDEMRAEAVNLDYRPGWIPANGSGFRHTYKAIGDFG